MANESVIFCTRSVSWRQKRVESKRAPETHRAGTREIRAAGNKNLSASHDDPTRHRFRLAFHRFHGCFEANLCARALISGEAARAHAACSACVHWRRSCVRALTRVFRKNNFVAKLAAPINALPFLGFRIWHLWRAFGVVCASIQRKTHTNIFPSKSPHSNVRTNTHTHKHTYTHTNKQTHQQTLYTTQRSARTSTSKIVGCKREAIVK